MTNRDGDILFCQTEGTITFECPPEYECLVRGNPGVGLGNWDNIGIAVLTQFELITLEGWTDVMYKLRNAQGGDKFFDIFFVLSVVFGAFFVLNLMIAVQFQFLNDAFEEVAEQQERDRKTALAEQRDNE